MVLLTETVHEAGLALLQARPDLRVVQACPADPACAAALAGCSAIGVRIVRLGAETLERAPHLKIVSKHGVGTDAIDVAWLTARGIPVTATLDANAISVAEHTMMLMLAAAKRLHAYDSRMRAGDWAFRDSLAGIELAGRTVLIIGYGRVGRRVAALCEAFGMRVLVHGRVPAGSTVEIRDDLDEALAEAEIVTLHVPRTAATTNLIDASRIGLMRPGAVLVNCARGGIVDEAALTVALRTGRIGAAGIDVFDIEPMAAGHPLAALPNVVLTPHSAASTMESARRMSVAMARNILDGLDGTLDPASVVNPSVLG